MTRNRFSLLILTVFLGVGSGVWTAACWAQGRTIDLGAGTTERIAAEHDPDTWQELPPFAFGEYEPRQGNTAYIEVIPLRCIDLPDPGLCQEGTFVAGLGATFGADPTCSCEGILVKDILVQIRYDEARLRELGAPESALEMVIYDSSSGRWFPMPGGYEVIEDADLVQGQQGHHAIQTYALRVLPIDSRTWGAIKALWH